MNKDDYKHKIKILEDRLIQKIMKKNEKA